MKTHFQSRLGLAYVAMFLLIATYGCSQLSGLASKNYQNGDYDAAVRYAVQALKKKPTNSKAQEVIVPAFNAAVTMYETKISETKSMSAQFRGDETVTQRANVVDLYSKVISLQNEVKSLPAITPKNASSPLKFDFKDYTHQLLDARESLLDSKTQAAELHYQKGVQLMESDNLEQNKKAALEFKQALAFVDPYKDAKEMYDRARAAGTKRIAVIPFDNKSGKINFGAVGEIQSDLIISALINDKQASEFIEVISRDRLDDVIREQKLNDSGLMDENSLVEVGKILGVHEMITGKITQIATNLPKTVTRSYPEKKSVVIERKEYVESGVKKYKDIYGEVSANVTEYKKVASAKMIGSFSVIDVRTAKVIKSDTFSEDYQFACDWGKFTGDERAMSDYSRDLCKKGEKIAPSEEDMVNKISESLAAKLAKKIIEWAK